MNRRRKGRRNCCIQEAITYKKQFTKTKKNDKTTNIFAIPPKKIDKIILQTFYQNHMKMETIFVNTENSRTNKSDKLFYYFTD